MATRFLLLMCIILLGCTNSDNTQKNDKHPIKADTLRTKTLYFNDSGYSSILLRRDTINGFPEIEQISRSQSYHFIRFLEYSTGGMGVRHALINELSVQQTRDAPSDYSDGKIILKTRVPNVNPIQDTSNLYKIDWIDSVNANKVHYREEFIEAIQFRETEKPIKKIFDYSTGKNIIELSSKLYGLQLPDGYDRRYIAYLEKPNITEHESFDTIPDLYGILTYANPITNKSQVLLLKTEQDAGPSSIWRYEYFDELSLEGVQEKTKNESFQMKSSQYQQWKYSDFKSFHIILKFKGVENIVLHVPIRNDLIDTSNLRSNTFEFQLR